MRLNLVMMHVMLQKNSMKGALSFDWSLIFAPKAPLPFVYMSNVKLKSILSLQHLRVKDGVVDSFMEAVGRVQVLILNNPKLPLCIGG
jgi:23S rRNA G2445 N2-methylase RlmL